MNCVILWVPSVGHEAPLLLRPSPIYYEAGIIAQIVLQLPPDRLWIGMKVTIKRPKARSFLGDNVADAGKILIGSYREQADEQPVEHGKTREREAYHFVGTLLTVEPSRGRKRKEKNEKPRQADEYCGEQRAHVQTRVVVDPIEQDALLTPFGFKIQNLIFFDIDRRPTTASDWIEREH